MGYRIFRDSQGTEWQAWDVRPQLSERRVAERRSHAQRVDAERRRAVERRTSSGRRPFLTNGLDGGWLCFETTAEKRRLAPVPGDWMKCAIQQLEEYLRRATPTPAVRFGPILKTG